MSGLLSVMCLRITQCSAAGDRTVSLSCPVGVTVSDSHCALDRVGDLLCFPAEACDIRYRLGHVHIDVDVRDVVRKLRGLFSIDSLAAPSRGIPLDTDCLGIGEWLGQYKVANN